MALEHTHTFSKYSFSVGSYFKFMLWSLYMIQIFTKFYIMYIYLSSMIISHISLQKYFEKFPKSRKNPISKLFQAWRSTGPVDRTCSRPGLSTGRSTAPCVRDVYGCARQSVDRPVDRLEPCCSLFPFGRLTVQEKFSPLWPVHRLVDRVQRLYTKWTVGRPGRSTDSHPCCPTALSSFVKF